MSERLFRTLPLVALLAAAFCGAAFVPDAAYGQDKEDVQALEEEASSRRKELEELKGLLSDERQRLARARRKEESVLDLLEESEIAIDRLEKEKADAEARVAVLEKSIAKAKKDIAQSRKRLERQRKDLAKRLVGLYKLGPVGSMRVLLGSSSVSQFQRDRYYLQRILKQDGALVEEFHKTLRGLEDMEESLSRQRAELDAKLVSLKGNRQQLIVERDNRLVIVRAVRKQRDRYEEAVQALASQSEELENLLDLIDRRIRSHVLLGGRAGGKEGLRFADFRGSLLPPVRGELLSHFGRHVNERFGTVTFNNGIEIAAPAGTPIEAVFGGVVIFADRFKGYGNLVILNHGESFYSLYAHCQRIRKVVGDPVETREVIGWVGESGSLQGPTCYFEVRKEGKALNPADWLLME